MHDPNKAFRHKKLSHPFNYVRLLCTNCGALTEMKKAIWHSLSYKDRISWKCKACGARGHVIEIDPDKEAKKKDHPYASPRPYQPILRIRCDASNCGQQMMVTRETWAGTEEIPCSNCGECHYWSIL